MKSPRQAIVCLVLVTSALAGCTSFGGSDTETNAIKIGTPDRGDRFTYQAADGTEMVVRIGNETVASDRYFVPQPAINISYTIRGPQVPALTTTVVESLATQNGLLVRQTKTCEWESDEIRNECGEIAAVFFASSGLPGALGAGPFWGTGSIPGNGGTLSANTPLPAIRELNFTVTPAKEGCANLQYRPVDPAPSLHGAWMATTVLYEPATFCPGIPMPVKWRPTAEFSTLITEDPRPQFVLVDWQVAGNEPLPMAKRPSVPTSNPSPPIPLREWNDIFLAPNETPYLTFTSNEAYEKARDLDDEFDRLAGQGALLVYNALQPGGGTTCCAVPVYETQAQLRTLGLQHPDGMYQIQITKSITRSAAGESPIPTYAVISSSEEAAPGVSSDVAKQPSADPTAAIELSQKIYGKQVWGTFYRFEIRDLRPDGDRIFRTDGYVVTTNVVAEPDEYGVMLAFRLEVDGPSGTPILVEVPPNRLGSF